MSMPEVYGYDIQVRVREDKVEKEFRIVLFLVKVRRNG